MTLHSEIGTCLSQLEHILGTQHYSLGLMLHKLTCIMLKGISAERKLYWTVPALPYSHERMLNGALYAVANTPQHTPVMTK